MNKRASQCKARWTTERAKAAARLEGWSLSRPPGWQANCLGSRKSLRRVRKRMRPLSLAYQPVGTVTFVGLWQKRRATFVRDARSLIAFDFCDSNCDCSTPATSDIFSLVWRSILAKSKASTWSHPSSLATFAANRSKSQ